MIKALLFDMDGVLVDSEKIHHEARLQVYAKYGLDYEKVRHIPVAGRNTHSIFGDVQKVLPFPVPLEQAIHDKHETFVRMLDKPVKPLPGVIPLLKRYAGSLSIALVSASVRMNVEAVMKSSGLTPYFPERIYAEDVTRYKPHPEAYLLAASRLHLAPSDCLVFEDSGIGVQAAKRAGAGVVGVNTGYPEDLSAADLVVDDMEKGLEDIIARIEGRKPI